MRVMSRVALIVIVVCGLAFPLSAQNNFLADCPMSLVSTDAATTDFSLSPHGVFRFGSQIFVLRGQTLTTYNVSDTGNFAPVRQDFIGSMAARETNGGVTFNNGILFVSSEAGLEIFDLRNVHPGAGGSAPILLSRSPGLHYRRLAISGNTLAAVFPSTDMPCYPNFSSFCFNRIDLFDVTNLNAPVQAGSISSLLTRSFLGWNDVAFNQGFLYATGDATTTIFNVMDPTKPAIMGQVAVPGKFLISNGTTLLAIGNDQTITIYTVGLSGALTLFQTYVLPGDTFNRANPIMFHRQGFVDAQNGRMVTMVDELDPETLQPARTVAIDVFDFTVPLYEGSYQRIYENISMTTPDEVKYNPVAIGSYVYVVGSLSGMQAYGACGNIVGRIEWDGTAALNCGVSEIRGWVTGAQKVVNVELFLDGNSLGKTSIGGVPRTDISSTTPVYTWRVNVDTSVLSQTSAAPTVHTLRAVATDAFGNQRQFASQQFTLLQGPNCTNFRRSAHH